MSEQDWISGNRAAWVSLIKQAAKELGYDDLETDKARWVLEREAALVALRQICAKHGDNDWDEELHLADIIDKHLGRHL